MWVFCCFQISVLACMGSKIIELQKSNPIFGFVQNNLNLFYSPYCTQTSILIYLEFFCKILVKSTASTLIQNNYPYLISNFYFKTRRSLIFFWSGEVSSGSLFSRSHYQWYRSSICIRILMNCLILTFFSVFSTFQVRTVLDLQDSRKTCIILVYPGLCTISTIQPCFWGYPLKVNLTRDRCQGHLRAPMLQHEVRSIIVMFFMDLGCASLSNFGSKTFLFAPHDCLVFARQHRVSRFIRERT